MGSSKGWACTLAPLTLRLALGSIFVAHGYQKVFVNGTAAVSESFAQMGMILPQVTGPLVCYTEFIGGIFLLVGFLTPLASFMIACVMAVAVLLVHLPNGLIGQGGYEFPLSLLAGALALLFMGAGPLSLDGLFFGREKNPIP